MIAVVDAGPLFAVADGGDAYHERCVELLSNPSLQLVVPALAVAEAAYLVGTRLGPEAEAAFLEGMAALDIDPPRHEDWRRIGQLVRQYADVPLGGVDASVVATAERLGAATVITVDRRHFSAVRPRHVEAFTLLP